MVSCSVFLCINVLAGVLFVTGTGLHIFFRVRSGFVGGGFSGLVFSYVS
jgi:hypothetical protein